MYKYKTQYKLVLDDYIVTDVEAIQFGLPYKATLYGVSIYTDNDKQNPSLIPKFVPLNYWIHFVEFLVDVVLMITPNHVTYELPIKNAKRIELP